MASACHIYAIRYSIILWQLTVNGLSSVSQLGNARHIIN